MSDGARFRFFYKGKAYLIPKDYIDDEHPGGGDEIWPWVNKDMTDAFEDADHSLDAVEMLEEYLDVDYDPNDTTQPGDEDKKETEKENSKEKLQAAHASGAKETSAPVSVAAAVAAIAPSITPSSESAGLPAKMEGKGSPAPVVVASTAGVTVAVAASAAVGVAAVAVAAVVWMRLAKKQ